MPSELQTCRHCGTPFREGAGSGDFCCSGCEYVHRLIREEGFDRYYDLRDRTTAPVQSAPFIARDLEWVADLQAGAEAAAGTGTARAELDLQGISCVGCVWLIDKLFRRRPGAAGADIDAQRGRMVLRWQPGGFQLLPFVEEIQRFGYLAGPARAGGRGDASLLVWRIGLCAVFALNGMLFALPGYLGMGEGFEYARLFDLLSLAFATLSLAVGGSYFIVRAWAALRAGVPHIDLPIALGVLLAYAGSLAGWAFGDSSFVYFDFVSVFVFLMLAGRWVQEAAVERNRHRVLSDPSEGGTVFRVSPDGRTEAVPSDAVAPGDTLEVRPGRTVPVQARLLSPAASISLESINGESRPLACSRGRLLPSGALNIGTGAIRVEAMERWDESLLARLVGTRGDRVERNRPFERVLKVYVFAVLLVAAGGALGWALAGAGAARALQVAVSVLVVSCPCSLGVAWPLAVELATLAARGRRVFVRSETVWPRLPRVRKVVFDKTGTLTLERPELLNPEALEALDADARAHLFALVEASLHPVSRSLRERLYARFPGVRETQIESGPPEEVPGAGLALVSPSGRWTLGKPGWAAGGRPRDLSPDDGEESRTELAREGRVLAVFRTADRVRPETRREIDTLRRAGLEVHLLSGDRPERVARVAADLGLPPECARSGQSPADKAAWISSIDKMDTLMVGDGVNDSLAFDAAYCRGTPLVDRSLLERKSDFFLVGRAAGGVCELLRIASLRRRASRAVFTFALLYNLGAVAVCLAGRMSPLLAAILMPLSGLVSVALVFQGLRPVLGRSRP